MLDRGGSAVDATGSTAHAISDTGATGADDNSASSHTEPLRCLAKSIRCNDGSAANDSLRRLPDRLP